MRTRIRRRSVSSFVSPGPRVPMPPPSRDNAVHEPTSRGSRYFSCASSTCHLPSRVRARRAKMSRISCVRSITFRSSAASSCRSCAGDELVVEDHHVDVGFVAGRGEAVELAAADEGRRIGLRALLSTRRTTVAPAASARPASSSSDCSASCGARTRHEADECGAFWRHRTIVQIFAAVEAGLKTRRYEPQRMSRSSSKRPKRPSVSASRCRDKPAACTRSRRSGRGADGSTRREELSECLGLIDSRR